MEPIGISGGIEFEVEEEDEFSIDGSDVGIGYWLCFGIGGQATASPSTEAEPPVIAQGISGQLGLEKPLHSELPDWSAI